MKNLYVIFTFFLLWQSSITQAQYAGGNGRGDVQLRTTGLNFPVVGYTGGNGRGDATAVQLGTDLNGSSLSITSFTPTSGCAGSGIVIITGTSFTGATAVNIGGSPVNSFTVNSATQITAIIGIGSTGTVQVTTAAGTTTSSGSFTVISVSAYATTGAIACYGGSTSVTVSAYGGSGAYTGTGTFTQTAGTTVYTVVDGNGCSATTSTTTTQPAQLVPSSTSNSSLCFGGQGSVTVAAIGGTTPYTGTGIFNQPAGSYTYTVTDANGCTATTSGTITQPLQLIPSSTTSSPLCFGGQGSVTVSATGGTTPYSGTGTFVQSAGSYSYTVADANGCYATTSGSITQPAQLIPSSTASSPLCFGGQGSVTVSATGGTTPYNGTGTFVKPAGSYSYTVTDANGCTSNTSGTITQPTQLIPSSITSSPLCFGGQGSVTVSATGGTLPYSGTGTFTQSAGSYSYTVTDANGCTATTSDTITQPIQLIPSSTTSSPLCFGGHGSVTVSATGGTTPYSGTGTFVQSAGSYSYTVADANGCSAITSGTITQPAQLTPSSTSGSPLCFGGQGSVTVSATGGTTPYSGTGTFVQSAGSYSYTVTDANGCSATTSGTITQPAQLIPSSTTSSPLCFGGQGSVTVSATGGTSPYSGTGIFPQPAGSYSYTVTDANGCSAISSGTITQPAQLIPSSTTSSPVCFGGQGYVTVSASGGTSPYIGTGIFARPAGSYTYTVTDVNGCSATTSGSITQPAQLIPSSTTSSPLCFGGQGSVTVSATGGTSPYTGTGTFVQTAGSYSYTVTDAHGCTAIASGNLSQPAAFAATAAVINPVACFGGMATVNVSAFGGISPLTGDGQYSVGAGTWDFVVTDANGCVANSNSITLTEPTKVLGVTSAVDATCNYNNGSMQVTASGGSSPYQYSWSSGQTTASVSGMAVGTYTVVITDANGCTGSATAIIGNSGGGPNAPGAISGAAGTCRNSIIVYSVPTQADATSYAWSLPSGATGTSSTNSISVNFGPSYNGGFICVTPVNACGSGPAACLNVPVLTVKPSYPGLISGPAFACGPNTYTYSIAPVQNATSYNWTVTGTGVSIIGGNGSNAVQVSVASGFGQGTISVMAMNCVGNSSFRLQTITGIPTHSSPLTGNIFACPNSLGSYSINTVNGTSGYVWSITGNATIASSNANSCVVNFLSNWNGGSLTVTTSSICGSYSRSYALNAAPAQPGAITGPANNLCYAAGVTSASYSIAAVTGATSYTWTIPSGMTITGNTGTSITVSISSVFISGNVCVSANNTCGSSTSRCLPVSNKTAAPSGISGPLNVCKSDVADVYTIPAVTGATGYAWSITGGAVITPSGTSATVNYTSSTLVSSTITVTAQNECGQSSPTRITSTVNLSCKEDKTTSGSVILYPNPAHDEFTLNFFVAVPGDVTIEMYDILGHCVESLVAPIESAGEASITVNLSNKNLSDGLYLVRIIRKDQTDEIRMIRRSE